MGNLQLVGHVTKRCNGAEMAFRFLHNIKITRAISAR